MTNKYAVAKACVDTFDIIDGSSSTIMNIVFSYSTYTLHADTSFVTFKDFKILVVDITGDNPDTELKPKKYLNFLGNNMLVIGSNTAVFGSSYKELEEVESEISLMIGTELVTPIIFQITYLEDIDEVQLKLLLETGGLDL